MANSYPGGLLQDNFEGAIEALNTKRVANYQSRKDYPANYAGIVAAILDCYS